MSINSELALKIQKILDTNTIVDLNKDLKKRHCLNNTNLFLVYFFHLCQSGGILVTAVATGTNYTRLIWLGIGLNILASLINVYEKTNNAILANLLADINLMKAGKYVDESAFINDDMDEERKSTNTLTQPLINSNNSTTLL